MRTTLIRIVIAVAGLATLTAGWFWLARPDVVPVTTVVAERGRVEETVTNSRAGTVKARQRAHLSPEIGGRVVSLNYRKGDQVKAGEIMLRLNDSSQRASLLLAQRDHTVAKAQREKACLEADRARREYQRNKKLSAQQFVSEDFLEKLHSTSQTTAAACRAARASIDRAQAAINEAEAELEKTLIRAPFDGVIAEMDIEVGEWTTPAPPAVPVPAILDLIDPSSIYVSAPMDEVDLARIHPAQSVRITLDPYPGQDFTGRVTRVAPYVLDVEEQNRTVEIEVELLDKAFASKLLPGTSADVEVILSARENVLRIPTPALIEGNKVFLIQDGHLAETSVTTGLKNWDFVEITAGLTTGQAIVTSLERPGLSPGVRIHVQNSEG